MVELSSKHCLSGLGCMVELSVAYDGGVIVTTVKCYYSQVLLQSSKHCLI